MGGVELVAIAGNIAALVWGAAKMSAELAHTRQTVDKLEARLEEAIKALADTLTDHGERIARLEGRRDVG